MAMHTVTRDDETSESLLQWKSVNANTLIGESTFSISTEKAKEFGLLCVFLFIMNP